MIRITTSLEAKEIAAALQKQPRQVLIDFVSQVLINHKDATVLEEVADNLLAELERRALDSRVE